MHPTTDNVKTAANSYDATSVLALAGILLCLACISLVAACSESRKDGPEKPGPSKQVPEVAATQRAKVVFDTASVDDAPSPAELRAQPAFRQLSIPKREHSYSGFESIVIYTQDELNSFLEAIQQPAHREIAVRAANIDFGKEALALLRYTEASGSTIVSLGRPSLTGTRLSVPIKTQHPDDGGTDDMAYYCFALAVDTSLAESVVLQWGEHELVTLSLTGP